MSSIRKATVMGYPRVETESSPFVRPTNGLLTHAVESADFAEFVRKLSKSTWCLRGRGSLAQFSVLRSHSRWSAE